MKVARAGRRDIFTEVAEIRRPNQRRCYPVVPCDR